MTRKARRRIAAAPKARIVLEAPRGQAAAADLAHCREVRPNPVYAWKKQPPEQAARAFGAGAGVGDGAGAIREREIAKPRAKIGQLTADGSTSPP
ncbi:MAG: hypothetical protein WBE62_04290 [Methylocella sp.]